MTFLAFPNIVPPNDQTKFETYPGYEWAYRLTMFGKQLANAINNVQPPGPPPSGISITATTPIVVTPSPITGTGDIEHAASGVTAGTYGDATDIPQITVTAKGHVTAASNIPLGGIGSPIQGSLASLTFRCIKVAPGLTQPSVFGFTTVNIGTASFPVLSNTNLFTSSEYLNFQTAGAKPNFAGIKTVGVMNMWRGNAPLLGGFFFSFVCGASLVPTGFRAYFGASNDTSSNLANAEPSTYINCFWFACDSTDSNWQIMVNDGSGSCTKIDTGFSCTTALQDMFRVQFQCTPNSNVLNYYVKRLNDGSVFGPGSISGNLPDNSLFMNPRWETNNGATAGGGSACAIAFCSAYEEAIV